MKRASVSVALLVSLCAAPAFAQEVTVTFAGRITDVDNSPFPGIAVDTPFTGSYTFNAAASDDNPMAQVGDYWHYAAPYGVTLTIAGHTFRTDPTNVQFLVEW